MADLRLPPPWADEAYFLWQAVNIAQHTSLFTPQLNTERIIIFQVPGYQILMGMLFKMIPFSLETARAVSWLLALIAYLELLWLFGRRRLPLLVITGASFWYLSAHFVILGNTARMEALHLVCVVAAFINFDTGRPYKALAILLLCPLIHPNGVIFLVFGLLYALYQGIYRHAPSHTDYVLLALPLLCIAGFIIFAVSNWQAFVSDMAYQFGDKAAHYTPTTTLRQPRIFVPLIVVLCTSMTHVLLFKNVKTLVVFAVALLLPQIIADELFYGIYTSVAFLTTIPLAMDIVANIAERLKRTSLNATTAVLSMFVIAGLLVLAHQVSFVESPLHYPHKMTFGGMRLRVSPPYLTREDQEKVIKAVQMQLAGAYGTVVFWPLADSLLYWPIQDRGFLPYQPLFTEIRPDVVVFHTSRYIPGWWQLWIKEFWERFQLEDSDLVRKRDGTEAWYVRKCE